MNRSTLPRHARAHAPGWAHPYALTPFAPVFYADGGDADEDEEEKPDGEEEGEEKPDEEPDDDALDPDGAEALGDKGKRALDAMKAKLKTEREKRRAAEAKLQDKPAGADGDADQIQAKADATATARANTRILRSEVRAAAAGKLNDPKDALTFLDLDQFEVDEDGQVDEDEIADAITDLIKSKPYLAAATVKRFQGTGDGGSARTASKPKQLSRADLKTMSPAQIVKAKAEGRLDDALGISG